MQDNIGKIEKQIPSMQGRAEENFYELLDDFFIMQDPYAYENILLGLLKAGIGLEDIPVSHTPIQTSNALTGAYEIGKFVRNIQCLLESGFKQPTEEFKIIAEIAYIISYDHLIEDTTFCVDRYIINEDPGSSITLSYLERMVKGFKNVFDLIHLCEEIKDKYEKKKGGVKL